MTDTARTGPPAPEPDDKDWTWTLQRRCPDCGFAAGATPAAGVPALVDAVVGRFTARLRAADALARPAPQVWSVTEYACHVRDVCLVFDERLQSMLTETDPMFANWDQDATARQERYWLREPQHVAGELAGAAARIVTTIGSVQGEQWERPGRRSNGSTFTVETLVQYFAHDLVHHTWDIGAGSVEARSGTG